MARIGAKVVHVGKFTLTALLPPHRAVWRILVNISTPRETQDAPN